MQADVYAGYDRLYAAGRQPGSVDTTIPISPWTTQGLREPLPRLLAKRPK